MRTSLLTGLVALSVCPALAGGLNANYLVPAFVACPGPQTCGSPRRESRFTFDVAILRSPRVKYTSPSKPSVVVELRGVKDASGAPVTSNDFTVRLAVGQVTLPTLGITVPPGHPLLQVPPVSITLKKGNGHVSYRPFAQAPPGTVAEGGNVTVFDSDGKRLATVGAQFK